MSHLDDLIQAQKEQEDAGIALIASYNAIATELSEFKNQTPEVIALTEKLRANAKAYSDTVLANTPADPNA